MYLGGVGETAAFQLALEILTNATDELTNPSTNGDTVWFTFMEKECKFIIEDNGRGIPLDILYDVVNKKHYSTKFNREFNKYSGGQNGVGTTITAALSDSYILQCYRDGQTRKVYMSGNELIDDGIKNADPKKHGTYVEFIPSTKWLGSFIITCDDVQDFLRRLSYVLPDGIKIKYLQVPKKGKELARTYTRAGLGAAVEYMSQTLEFPPILLSIPEQVIEDDDESQYFRLQFAFSYDRTLDEMMISSFCNYLTTREGGYHEQVVMQAITAFFTRQAKALDPNSKYEVTADDCKKGLIFAVNCDHSNPKFEGQHKSKVDQKNILQYGRKPITDALTVYFETNNGLLRKIVQYLRQISKIRQEAHKIKNISIKKPTTFLDDAEIGDIFVNISDRNYTGYKELILAEGDSAISAVGSARNVKCQAIFAVTGVVGNTFGQKTAKVMESPTYQALVKVLGCGIGKDFDINKLKWNSIILSADADVDGSNITSLLCVFFLCHMPEIITSGRLYRALPPLYRLNEKTLKKYHQQRDAFLFSKKEYYDLFHHVVAETVEVSMVHPTNMNQVIKGAGEITELSKKQLVSMLNQCIEYYPELENLQKRSACNIYVLEFVCLFLELTYQLDDNWEFEFNKLLHKKFPELSYDSNLQSINGSFEGENITLIIDKIFMKMAARMLRIMKEMPTFYVLVRNRQKTDDPQSEWECMTYGQLMKLCNETMSVDIEQRYKGLGESDAIMSFPSLMNPKTRRLVRLTMDDVIKTTETFRLLHGDSNELREARRQLLANADITLQDIDN
jgi:DNA gyrase subunit B